MRLAKDSTNVMPQGSRFATTRWSVVLAAADNAAASDFNEALGALCNAYWYPLYAFVRRQGHSSDDAQDLTQAFFACLLEKNYLRQADRNRGRFRSFLLSALKHFLADEHDRATALKRGGGRALVSLDALREAESRYALEPAAGLTPEQIFERRWTLTILDQVLSRLRADYSRHGKQQLFDRLKVFLLGENPADTYAAAASELSMSEGAIKVSVHRLRQRYADALTEEIAQTVETESEIDDEIRHLFESLG